MKIQEFKLERYFAKYEFSTKYLISSSDCDGYSLDYILKQASRDELKLWNELSFAYTDSSGSEYLRQAISNQYKSISENQIKVMTPGEANFILMNVLLEKGDEVVCMAPAYQSLFQVAESLGARIKFWSPEENNSKYYYNPDALEQLVNEKTKLIIVNFPHNPTGFIPTATDLNKIIEIARRYDTIMFSDEMYHQIIHGPKDEIPALCDVYENAISLWGMAKSFGLAGMRFGWLSSKRQNILEKIVSFKDYLSICNNAAGEVLTYIALNHKEKFIQPNIEKILRNKNLFREFTNRNSEIIEFGDTNACSTALVKLKLDIPTYKYCEKLVQETGIMMIPSEMFDYGSSHVRIGFGRENFPEILEVWSGYMKKAKID